MRSLSLWQPWATLWAHGIKQYETRGWNTNYRGELAIHAAQRWDLNLARLCQTEPFRSALESLGYTIPAHEIHGPADCGLPRGGVIGVVLIEDCKFTGGVAPQNWLQDLTKKERAFGDFSKRRFAIQAGQQRPIPLVPCKGAQGLFFLPNDVVIQVRSHLRQKARA
jgi:hypothetical protein